MSALNRDAGLLGSLLVLAIAGCQSVSQPETVNAESVTALPPLTGLKSLAGEPCEAREDVTFTALPEGLRQVALYCNADTKPQGHVFTETPATPGQPGGTERGWWQDFLAERARCQAPRAAMLAGSHEGRLQDCTLHNGGWPYLAVETEINGKTYYGDGLPGLLPVIEQAVLTQAGKASGPDRAMSPAVQSIASDPRLAKLTAADLTRFLELMEGGAYYNSVKDFIAAESKYRDALLLHESRLGGDNPETGDVLVHIALELSNQQRFSEAEALFARVSKRLNKAVERADYARYLSYRAIHAANQGRYQEALDLAHRSTEMRKIDSGLTQAANARPEPVGALLAQERPVPAQLLANAKTANALPVVQSLYLEAAMQNRLGDPSTASTLLGEAQAILEKSLVAPPSWAPELIGLEARIARKARAQDKAPMGSRFNDAARLWNNYVPEQRPEALSYLALGEDLAAQGSEQDAWQAFNNGIDLVRKRNGTVSYRQVYPYFILALKMAEQNPAQRDDIHAKMLEVSQLVRGDVTRQAIANAAARLATSGQPGGNAIKELQDAQEQQYFLYRDLLAEVAASEIDNNQADVETLRSKLKETEARVAQLNAQVSKEYPHYNQLVDQIVPGRTIAAAVRPGEALVNVLVGDPQSLLFLVEHGKITAHKLDIAREEVNVLVNGLRLALDDSRQRFDIGQAHALYQRLLGPVDADIKTVKHLITVPTGSLISLPFGLLVTDKPSGSVELKDANYLVKRSAISLLPSVRSVVDLRQEATGVSGSAARKAFLGFGGFRQYPPAVIQNLGLNLSRECQGNDERIGQYRRQLAGLSSLDGTGREVSEIGRLFGGDGARVVVGERFTESGVFKSALDDYRIVYFASHGIMPGEVECQPQPSLAAPFTRPPVAGEDGLVDAAEILLRVKLNADLVVLSGCNTGRNGSTQNENRGGESLSAFARAFFFAGARTLLASHWSVPDEETADLMIDMFASAKKDPDLGWAGAMRAAQMKMIARADGASPLLWAGFTVIGDGERTVPVFARRNAVASQ